MSDDFMAPFESLDKYYPGSKRVRRSMTESRVFPVKMTEDDAWDAKSQMKRLPNGREVEMFTAGALAAALQRPLVTIRKWELKGYIPKAPYRFRESVVAGERKPGRRLYTRALIEATVEAFASRGLLGRVRIDWNRHTDLSLELLEIWKRIHLSETN